MESPKNTKSGPNCIPIEVLQFFGTQKCKQHSFSLVTYNIHSACNAPKYFFKFIQMPCCTVSVITIVSLSIQHAIASICKIAKLNSGGPQSGRNLGAN